MASTLSIDTDQDLRHLIYFFDRFTNPIYTAKGLQQDVVFKIPQSYFNLNEEYKRAYEEVESFLSSKTSGKIIQVKELPGDIDLSKINNAIGIKEHFTLFNPNHQDAAGVLIGMLLGAKKEDLISLCVKVNLKGVNPYLFEYALSVALLHRPDTQGIPLPSPTSFAPEFYFNMQSMRLVEREGQIFRKSENRGYIELNPTGTDLDPEHRLWYFREDAGINMHHWHWHLVYPFNAGPTQEGHDVVNKDRRGELFYYMHAQIMARYNTERLINKLNRAKSFFYFREQVTPAYFSKLDTPFIDTHWASRHTNAELSDINNGLSFRILDLELWRDRILGAIHNKYFLKEDTLKKFEEDPKGIDTLGNMVESSVLSVNQAFYGNLHNFGHVAIALSHDPENKYLEDIAPMGDNRTAMRDPMFYRWHSFINDVFDTYKKALPSYNDDDLLFKGIQISDFNVTSQADGKLGFPALKNEFYTYMQKDLINVAFGTNIKFPGPTYILFPHLQHKDFQYNLKIYNDSDSDAVGTVRIFLAPATDETGTDTFHFNDQRRLFIELDKFVTPVLKKKSTTTVTQLSVNSSVTIPFAQMFLDLDDVHKYVTKNDPVDASKVAWCGCGWPHHMLIPKGKKSGYPCRLFVMISNNAIDAVPKSSMDLASSECKNCLKSESDIPQATAYSYCGKKGELYPDKRPMYFPFDRQISNTIGTVDDFVKPYSNMKVIDVPITFNDIKPMPEGPQIDPVESRFRIGVNY